MAKILVVEDDASLNRLVRAAIEGATRRQPSRHCRGHADGDPVFGGRVHAQEGNGLGLALVKKVIDTIGGTIAVESEIGKGTAFTVTLQAEE